MKKSFFILLSGLILLSGCGLASDESEAVQIDNKTYKTGFYGKLYPHEFSLTEQTVQGDDLTLVRIDHDTFDLYHADIGPYVSGTIYCEESQYEQVSEYYRNPANYKFFCIFGTNIPGETSAHTVELSDVDTAIFDDLLRFAEKSHYDPFNYWHNSEVETVDLPMPNDTVDTRLVFYKESNDSLFCSTHGSQYYIIDDSL